MPTILAVDDSTDDLARIQNVLAAAGSFRFIGAHNIQSALEAMRDDPPDLLLVDPIVPDNDKIAIVRQIRSEFPAIPAIIVTTIGNQDIAIRALRHGASSYVPKCLIETELVPTIRSVLDVTVSQRCRLRMLDQMQELNCIFVLDNDRALIPPLVGYLQEHVVRIGICDESEVTRVGIALDEALVNALLHGNLEMDSSMLETDAIEFQRMATERAKQEPYCNRRIRVDVRMCAARMQVTISDDGNGFNPEKLPDPTDPSNLERVSGRGVLLIRTFMDEIRYNDKGNSITLVKHGTKAG